MHRPKAQYPPCKSSIHLSPDKASSTERLLALLLETSAWTKGAISWMLLPSSHLSFQKSVLDPFPTTVVTAMVRRAATSLLTWIGRFAHGLLGSLLLSHGQRAFKAMHKVFRSAIPSPPSSRGRHTLGQAMRQCPPLPPFCLSTGKPF